MTRFYIIRHGESKGNSQNLFLGHTDMELTDRGHAQAELTSEFLKDKPIDVFYSSDLTRAYQTCKHIADKFGKEIITHRGLREIYAGQWEARVFNEILKDYPEFKVWLEDMPNARCTGGESVLELKERVESTLEEIAKANDGKTVCLVSHATPIRIMCRLFRGIPFEEITSLPWVPNASVTEAVYDKGKWTLIAEGIKDHIGDISTQLPSNV